ncbi:MAG: alpha/beta hydrolase [Cardiobacteriales bacterium]|nr:MAG: alpha/beta hydrolase [Cardiobacteriales bacterium]
MMYYQKIQSDAKNTDTLVLLHSGGMGGVEWQPQIKPLSKHFNLLVPDLLGHGKSLLPAGETLSVSLMAKAVIKMLTDESVEKAHILGSSMGGAVALWIALKYPQFVDKLIIYRIGYTKNGETYEQTRQMANPEYWKKYGLHRWLSQLHTPQGDENSWEQVIANVSKVLDPETSDHNHNLSDLQAIGSPTLLIAGDSDPLIPLDTLLAMKNAIPNCALWVMPQATHITASNTWRANHFSEEIFRFLK